MKTFNKIFLGFCLVAFLGMVSNLVSSYSTYGAPTEFGNINDTTCYIGGDDGILDCTGTVSGNMSWINLSSYPAACPSGYYISQLDDSVTCSIASFVNGSNIQVGLINATTVNATFLFGNGSGLTGVSGEGAISEIVEDTSPQLGGYLDTNDQTLGSTSDEIGDTYVATNNKTYYGTGQEAEVYYDGSALVLKVN